MDIKEQILVALGLNKEETSKLEWQSKSEDGTIFVSTAEELEAGVDIAVLTEDGTTILLPVGTYKTEDGVSFRVEEEGIVAIETGSVLRIKPFNEMGSVMELVRAFGKNEDFENAIKELEDEKKDISPLIDFIFEHVPPADRHGEGPFRMQPATLSYDDYLGRMAIGRLISTATETPRVRQWNQAAGHGKSGKPRATTCIRSSPIRSS